MTQLELAKKGITSKEVKEALKHDSHVNEDFITQGIANGTIVIPCNINRAIDNLKNIKSSFRSNNMKYHAIGAGLTTKVNANIGTSQKHASMEEELQKLQASLKAGTHSVMDLSTGSTNKEDLLQMRKILMDNCNVMMGSVPMYQTASNLIKEKKPISSMTEDQLFNDIEEQCKMGIDYITVHCGITNNSINRILKSGRVLGVVSRGGSLICGWMMKNEKENPLYKEFDRLLDIAYKYDVTLSLGDGFRPGSIVDSTDRGQIEELITLGELSEYAQSRNVQVIIEGPGHVPLNEIDANVKLQKKLCKNAPFYVLGPLTTDIAPGYDHITAAIGGAIASASGVDFLCYVTPAEHLMLPTAEDVYEGVIAARIAAHSGDIAKGIKTAIEKDRLISTYRRDLNWEGIYNIAIDPFKARERRSLSESFEEDVCTMCGDLCAIKTFNDAVTKK